MGTVALGMATLIWRPELLNRPMPWARAIEGSDQESAGLRPLPLVGPHSRQNKPSSITAPPPVIPQTLPPALNPEKTTPVPEPAGFSDLPPTHWAYPVVTELVDSNRLTGFPDGTFRPEQAITRAEFAAQISRLFNLSLLQEAQGFKDVTAEHWATQHVQKTFQMGFLTGYPEQSFEPDETISRIEVVAALAQGLNLKSSSGPDPVLNNYKDRDQVPDWAVRPLIAATEAGLVVNHPDLELLDPNAPATRAEVVAMLYRALVYMGELEDIPSPYWVIPASLPY